MDEFEFHRDGRELHVELFEPISEILFELDPIEINFETNTDEYEPEVGAILPRLCDCLSSEEAQKVIHDEFVRWFGAEVAGPAERYADVAAEVWMAWVRLQGPRYLCYCRASLIEVQPN